MVTVESIRAFMGCKSIAVVGVSRNPRKFGTLVYRHLKRKGYEVYPVNPNVDVIEGDRCFNDVMSLPQNVESMVVITPPQSTAAVVKEGVKSGIKNFWLQPGAESKEIIDYLQNSDVNAVYGQCIFMYTSPKGIHKLHAKIAQWTGRYLK